jgi:hypothetical protein
LTDVGADYFGWADDGKTITWAVGASFFREPLSAISFEPPKEEKKEGEKKAGETKDGDAQEAEKKDAGAQAADAKKEEKKDEKKEEKKPEKFKEQDKNVEEIAVTWKFHARLPRARSSCAERR